MKILNNLDLNQNELQNGVIQNLATAPSNPKEGQVYHNTTTHKTFIYNGTSWIDISATPETGTTDYTDLENKPSIGGIPLSGNKTLSDLGAIPSTEKGVANGVATLDSNGLVPSTQLPSYVDDVEEYASTSAFPATGETGKIYVALDTNKTYRWGGSTYVEISQSEIHKYIGTCTGDGTTTTFTINHGLGTKDVVINIYNETDSEDIIADIVRTSTSAINVIFAEAPASGTNYKVVIIA